MTNLKHGTVTTMNLKDGPAGHGDSGDRGSWRGLAQPGCGCQHKIQARTTMGNSGTCSRWLFARPNPHADETRYGATADSAGQEKHSAT